LNALPDAPNVLETEIVPAAMVPVVVPFACLTKYTNGLFPAPALPAAPPAPPPSVPAAPALPAVPAPTVPALPVVPAAPATLPLLPPEPPPLFDGFESDDEHPEMSATTTSKHNVFSQISAVFMRPSRRAKMTQPGDGRGNAST
jgi:hypothetical protein